MTSQTSSSSMKVMFVGLLLLARFSSSILDGIEEENRARRRRPTNMTFIELDEVCEVIPDLHNTVAGLDATIDVGVLMSHLTPRQQRIINWRFRCGETIL